MPDQRHDLPHPFAVVRDGETTPSSLRGAVAAIGNFDGVHLGHQRLVEVVRKEAARRGAPGAVLTFEPHPRRLFRPDEPLFRLTPEPVKLEILARLGLGGAFVRGFDRALASLSARDFVARILVAELGLKGVVVGEDFHFGRNRDGTPTVLARLCREFGLWLAFVAPVEADGQVVSSSAVRASLRAGDVATGNRLLGYRWFVRGEVRHGQKLGRTLGFPTANLALGEDCDLGHGIYAVRAALPDGSIRDGVASFGRRPTFDNGAPLLETFLFDFSGDLYGCDLAVEFVGWIRGEERFASAEALRMRMEMDAQAAHACLTDAASTATRSFID